MNGYVAAGYSITLLTLVAYTLRVVLRARALGREGAPRDGDQPWR
jgi:hypothetical protein